jgi:hypothetical protein
MKTPLYYEIEKIQHMLISLESVMMDRIEYIKARLTNLKYEKEEEEE